MTAGIVPLLIALLASGPAAGTAQVPEAARIELPDQLGGSDSVDAHRERVTVVLVVTARRLRNLKGWQKELQERFDDVDFVLIADVPADPPVTYEQVVKKLEQRIPDEVSVLIDLERRWATELELDTERPNVLLFDRQSRLVASFRGLKEKGLVDRVSAALADLLAS